MLNSEERQHKKIIKTPVAVAIFVAIFLILGATYWTSQGIHSLQQDTHIPTPYFEISTLPTDPIVEYTSLPSELSQSYSFTVRGDGTVTAVYPLGHRLGGNYEFILSEEDLRDFIAELLSTGIIDFVLSNSPTDRLFIDTEHPSPGTTVADVDSAELRINLAVYESEKVRRNNLNVEVSSGYSQRGKFFSRTIAADEATQYKAATKVVYTLMNNLVEESKRTPQI